MYTDVHNHLIYGVDDGPKDLKGSMALVKMAVKQGIDEIISTPHIFPGMYDFPFDKYLLNLETVQRVCQDKEIPLRLYSGCEIFYTDATDRFLRDQRIPTLAGSQLVLVEFSTDVEYKTIQRAVDNISSVGYQTVIAHAERYAALHKLERVSELRRFNGALIQVNASTIAHADNVLHGRWVRHMLDREYVDLVGTDAHDAVRRPCKFDDCAKYLTEHYGKRYKNKLLSYASKVIFS